MLLPLTATVFVIVAGRTPKSRVSPESFEVFQLCILREIPDKDAAKMLDSKPNTISVRKKRCREILQSIIVRLNDDDPVLGLKSL